jgi:hypothetical protein
VVDMRTSTPASAEIASAPVTSYGLMIAPFEASSLFAALSLDDYHAISQPDAALRNITEQAHRASEDDDRCSCLRRARE